jgi:hypothetical protein
MANTRTNKHDDVKLVYKRMRHCVSPVRKTKHYHDVKAGQSHHKRIKIV